jgi:DNA repair exonuclease SbcCD ATPase subunit
MATTAQTALDVLGASARQNALAQGLQSHSEAVTGQIADVASSQQQMASAVDTLVATTGQSALDILALSDGQARLQQAAQTDRIDLAAKLAEIVQGQQQWAQRFDAAQGSMQTIAVSTASLEQQITRLQTALQTNVEGLTAALQTGSQDRQQVETKVGQDIQAMIEALSQIRQAHALLSEQMQQMQNKTQGQTTDIISAIERLRQPAPELKLSESSAKPASSVAAAAAESDQATPAAEVTANNPNTKLESSVAEAAAK